MKKNKYLMVRMSEDEIMWFAKYARKKQNTMSEITRNLIYHLKKGLIKLTK